MRAHFGFACVALTLAASFIGCQPVSPTADSAPSPSTAPRPITSAKSSGKIKVVPVSLSAVDLSDAVRPVPLLTGVDLAAAKNEWTSFVLELGPRTSGINYSLRLNAPARTSAKSTTTPSASSPATLLEAYQVLPMPVDVNRAGYVRHTGQDAARGDLPRALLPLPAKDGMVGLNTLRDSSRPSDPAATAPPATPVLLWIDVRVAADAPPGDYAATCEALANGQVVASVPLKLKVYDFALPDDRHLQVVGTLAWDDLQRLYPDRFEAIRPRLMKRGKDEYAAAVRSIDALAALAHRHRTSVVVPRLQPTVKWPPNAPPEIDWAEFDSLVGPWITGQAFDDKISSGYWPIPAPDMLGQFVRSSQLEYWSAAATHFDGNDWLSRAPVLIDKLTPGRATEAEALELSHLAAETLALHQQVRVGVPLESDQLNVAEAADKTGKRLDPSTTARIWAAAPGLVSAPPIRLWPDAAEQPMRYLRTDLPALVPYVGAGGDERDVRVWAWLAYLRQASLISFSDALPSLGDPTAPADPNELIWFYPGEWFGLEEPVPTIQLKWLRRTQEDYEYLWLARERGDRDTRVNALLMSQLLTKPVEIQPGQAPDPAFALMSGTTSQAVWTDARRLLAEMILLRTSGEAPAADPTHEHAVHIEMLRWAEPQERPLLMGRTVDWSADPNSEDPAVRLTFGVDIYNASAVTRGENLLGWTAAPPGWKIATRPGTAPVLPTYNVRRATLDAMFHLSKMTPAARRPMELTFTDGYTNRAASLDFVLPLATSDRREGRLAIDGKLDDDWTEADQLQNGPMVKLLSRPNLQRQKLEPASTPSRIYTSWAADNFYVAFNLGGISPVSRTQNFVDYQFRRAWSEDLCEILIQPVSVTGVTAPVLHIVCKPNGSNWVERKTASAPGRPTEKPWQDVEAGVRYAVRIEADQWRGEIAIPWKAILEAVADSSKENAPPALLRFNFVQHRSATGESASWAGPIDFGRDDSFMGVLYLRDPQDPKPFNRAAAAQ